MGDLYSSFTENNSNKKCSKENINIGDFVTLNNNLKYYIVGLDKSKKQFLGINYKEIYNFNDSNILEDSDKIFLNDIITKDPITKIICSDSYLQHRNRVKKNL